MKTGACLLVSLALHVTVLTYPVILLRSTGELIPVTVLNADQQYDSGSAGAGKRARIGKPAGGSRNRSAAQPSKPGDAAEKQNGFARQAAIADDAVRATESGAVVRIDGENTSASGPSESTALPAGEGENGAGGWTEGGGEYSGSGTGTGAGTGSGRGTQHVTFTQAAYTYNPKPAYPEIARKQGWEGTVILHVLIDERGRSKSLEISRSSGFAPLDDAALATVQNWRFSPARNGETRVESWVRIPIVFRLADLN